MKDVSLHSAMGADVDSEVKFRRMYPLVCHVGDGERASRIGITSALLQWCNAKQSHNDFMDRFKWDDMPEGH